MLVDKERLVEYAFAEVVCFVLSDAFHWIPKNYFQSGSLKKPTKLLFSLPALHFLT